MVLLQISFINTFTKPSLDKIKSPFDKSKCNLYNHKTSRNILAADFCNIGLSL